MLMYLHVHSYFENKRTQGASMHLSLLGSARVSPSSDAFGTWPRALSHTARGRQGN